MKREYTIAEVETVLSGLLSAYPEIPHEMVKNVAKIIEDLTASYSAMWYSVISLLDGGSPEAMKRKVFRSYPIIDRTKLVERLMERGVLSGQVSNSSEPGQCCDMGCLASTLQHDPMREVLPKPAIGTQTFATRHA